MCSLEICRDTSRRGTHAERLGEEELGTSGESVICGQPLSSRTRQAPLRCDTMTAEGPRAQWPVGLSIRVSAVTAKHTAGLPRVLLDPHAQHFHSLWAAPEDGLQGCRTSPDLLPLSVCWAEREQDWSPAVC